MRTPRAASCLFRTKLVGFSRARPVSDWSRERMGCCASKEAGDPGPPPHLQAATARTARLLESLAAKEERVEWPVLPNSTRSSGSGCSRG